MSYKHGDDLISKNMWFRSASFLTFYSLIGIANFIFYGINHFKIHNKHRLKGIKKAITVSNHTLFFDPLLIEAAIFPKRMYQTLLEDTVATPFVGTFTRLLGGMPVPKNDIRMKKLCHGASVALKYRDFLHFYPEGECYLYNDKPEKFHAGAFITAAFLDVPIIPMATVFKKNGVKPLVHLYILEPLKPRDFGLINSDGLINIKAAREFAENVRQLIINEIVKHNGTGVYSKGQMKRIPGINSVN